jgi:hypothetical protein
MGDCLQFDISRGRTIVPVFLALALALSALSALAALSVMLTGRGSWRLPARVLIKVRLRG